MMPTRGHVALVGAGPGDPGLITVRGRRLLQQADVVVYDYLANPRLLSHARIDAERIFVGKQAARHSMTQAEINQLLVDQARLGRRVVRLKGGDPFVFGRGGEEGETLRDAGVPFEVVPGITAAIAAPAYAGIPVTHRDFNSSFTLITGHEKEEAYKEDEAKARGAATGSSDLDWSAIAKLPCVAFYMGVKALPRIASRLIEAGRDPATPAATIQWGTMPKQRTCVATLGTIAEAATAAKITAPAITIIGQVVTMRDTLNWFERRPLFGQTIVVTRTRDQASELSQLLEDRGANVIEAPTIELAPVEDLSRVDSILNSKNIQAHAMHGMGVVQKANDASSDRPDWIVFTSANGVRVVRDRLRLSHLDARAFAGIQFAAIGEATADAIRELLCIEPDCVPARAVAEALSDELIAKHNVAGKRFALLRAEIARPVLVERLTAAGAHVEDVAVYTTKLPESLPADVIEAIDARGVQWITFTSSSTAKNLAALLGDDYAARLAGVKLASIGPVTTQTLLELGLNPTAVAEHADMAALAEAIVVATAPT